MRFTVPGCYLRSRELAQCEVATHSSSRAEILIQKYFSGSKRQPYAAESATPSLFILTVFSALGNANEMVLKAITTSIHISLGFIQIPSDVQFSFLPSYGVRAPWYQEEQHQKKEATGAGTLFEFATKRKRPREKISQIKCCPQSDSRDGGCPFSLYSSLWC